MAPCRQLLMWSVPSIAVLLGIFWFRKKREFAKSDPGGREKLRSLKEELAEVLNAELDSRRNSPLSITDGSIIKSSPIDIVPNGIGSQRSSPFELTDEEVDLEIEKIIRKKSLEKDKKVLSSIECQNILANSNMETPFIAKYQSSSLFSPRKAEKSSINPEDIVGSVIANKVDLNKSKASFTEEIEQDSTKYESVLSENNTNDSTAADTEQLNNGNNIVEPSDNDGANNRFSTQTRRISERDSANHSPVDPMLASPSMCHFSDNHSEVNIILTICFCSPVKLWFERQLEYFSDTSTSFQQMISKYHIYDILFILSLQ